MSGGDRARCDLSNESQGSGGTTAYRGCTKPAGHPPGCRPGAWSIHPREDVKEVGESNEARELREACEAAAHCFNTLIADDDEVLSVLRKLDGGEDLVSEIRSVARAWTDASQAFLESLTKATV